MTKMLISLIVVCLFLGSGIECFAEDADNRNLQNYYEYWRNKYLKRSQLVDGGGFVDYKDNRTTCSEAHGYGMLICVYMCRFHEDTARKDFDALDIFRRQFKSRIDSRLMSWYVDDKVGTPNKTTCATDGDLDIAYALILAAHEWKVPKYIAEAKKILADAATAMIFFASLISAPSNISSRAISSSGRSVNSRRKRPTSRSSVFRQNCQ